MKHCNEKKNRFPIFRERLNKLLDNMSTTDFAKKVGVSRQTMGFYLNGERIPDALGLAQICEKCNVASDWLIGITDDPRRDPCAVDALNLSAEVIDVIRNLSETERTGFEKMVSSELLKVLCSQLTIYNELPPYFDPRHDLAGEYVNADSNEKSIVAEIEKMHPEMRGRFSVLCGVKHAEQLKRQILNSVETMLLQMDWSKSNRN